jgi:hypothetical protein
MSNVSDPAKYGAAVTPSNSVNLAAPTRSLYIGTTGNVSIEMLNGTVVLTSVAVGILPVQCTRVNSTGTTASNIVALW